MNEASPLHAAELLDQVKGQIHRFIVVPEDAGDVMAAWVLHTYVLERAHYTPYLIIRSATRRCGKSNLLNLLGMLAKRPLHSANISPSALFRSVEEGNEPTMLLDEQDGLRTTAGINHDLRCMLNAGFERGKPVVRVERDPNGGFRPETFPVFCPKALATIGNLPETVTDRGVVIEMRRKRSSDAVERFREVLLADEIGELKEAINAWAGDAVTRLPLLTDQPDGLDDRGSDVFDPLFAIADDAGEPWATRLREAAVRLRQQQSKDVEDVKIDLLDAIRDAFTRRKAQYLHTREIIAELTADPASRWNEWRRGSPITPTALGRQLDAFGIDAYVKRVDGKQARGYDLKQFEDAFSRYLPPSAEESDGAPQGPNAAVPNVFLRVKPGGVDAPLMTSHALAQPSPAATSTDDDLPEAA